MNKIKQSFMHKSDTISYDSNPLDICYATSGSYDVTLISSNSLSRDTLFIDDYITVYPFPSPQGIYQSGDTLFSNPGFQTYQWYHNGIIINGSTDYFYAIYDSGDYILISSDDNGCEVEAVIYDVHIGIEELKFKNNISAYPNPASEFIIVRSKFLITAKEIFIHNLLGEKVLSVPIPCSGVSTSNRIRYSCASFRNLFHRCSFSRQKFPDKICETII